MGELRAQIFRFLRNAAFIIAGLLTLLLLTYGSLALWWRSGQVVISRDYVGEIMARSAQGAEPTPAWPKVLEIYERAKGPEISYLAADHPVHTKWPERMAHIKQNAGLIAELRAALDHDHLGILSSLVRQTDEGWVFEDPDTPGAPEPIRYSLDLTSPVIRTARPFREISSLLLHDAWRAAEEGDADTAATDLVAAFRLAEQSHTTTYLISDLVSISYFAKAMNQTSWITDAYPDLLKTEHREAIRDASLRFMDGHIRAELTDEITVTQDFEQWLFTDNGSGDGHIVVYLPDIEYGFEMLGENRPWSWRGALWLPIAPSRSEFRSMTERCYNALRAELRTPVHVSGETPMDQIRNEIESNWISRQRWSFHSLFSLFSGGRLARSYFRTTMHRDGMIAALAAQEFRQESGRWPADLEELVPQYLDAIPIDSFDGAPLRYRIDEAIGAPLIYSVGVNQIDDGGSSEFDPDPDAPAEELDFVLWPWPAAESDAEFFEDENSDDDEDPNG